MSAEETSLNTSCPACGAPVRVEHPSEHLGHETLSCSQCGVTLQVELDSRNLLEDDFGPITQPEYLLKVR